MVPLLDIILINSLSFLVGFGLGCFSIIKCFLIKKEPSDKVVQATCCAIPRQNKIILES
jgi:hypothetical protein